MKWLGLLLIMAAVPLLFQWLRRHPRLAPVLWAVLGFLPFVVDRWHLGVAPVSWATWPGYVKGLEVSLVDSIALAIVLARPPGRRLATFAWIWLAYIAVTLLSMQFAAEKQPSFFAAWQLARVFLTFTAATQICTDRRGPRSLLLGMTAGLCLHAGFAISERFSGVLQAEGLFSHQNFLGMTSHFVAFPALAMFLADRRQRLVLMGVLAAMIVAILGASRATIGLAGLGYILLLLLSIARMPTSRKWGILALGVTMLAVVTPLAIHSLDRRFAAQDVGGGDYDEREAFQKAARAILADHPLGIGANQYVVVANTQGYSQHAGVIWNSGSRSAHVHNTYLLVAAETGYQGLALLLVLMIGPIIVALRTAWRHRRDPRGDMILGAGVAMAIVALHCLYEWIFVTYALQLLFAMNMGMIVGLARQMRSVRAKAEPRARLPAGHAERARQGLQSQH